MTLFQRLNESFKWCVFLCFIKVMDWIENHGEAFLSKHTGVGKSLHRARALQKRHDDFEEVAQVREQAAGSHTCKSVSVSQVILNIYYILVQPYRKVQFLTKIRTKWQYLIWNTDFMITGQRVIFRK